jgi:hypothetical protein
VSKLRVIKSDNPNTEKTKVPAELFDDSRLSWKAVGVYLYILTLPENEPITIGAVAAGSNKDSYDSVKSAIDELIATGYLEEVEEPAGSGWVYLIESDLPHDNIYKIGKAKDPYARFEAIQACSPVQLKLVHKVWSSDITKLERKLHNLFAVQRVHHEWFRLNADQVAYICAIKGEQ